MVNQYGGNMPDAVGIPEEQLRKAAELAVCKINIDEEGELAIRHGVMSIPTLIVFKGGEIVNKSIGLISKDEILALL